MATVDEIRNDPEMRAENWDGYGAASVTCAALDAATRWSKWLLPLKPSWCSSFSSSPDGGVIWEVNHAGGNGGMLVEFEPDGRSVADCLMAAFGPKTVMEEAKQRIVRLERDLDAVLEALADTGFDTMRRYEESFDGWHGNLSPSWRADSISITSEVVEQIERYHIEHPTEYFLPDSDSEDGVDYAGD